MPASSVSFLDSLLMIPEDADRAAGEPRPARIQYRAHVVSGHASSFEALRASWHDELELFVGGESWLPVREAEVEEEVGYAFAISDPRQLGHSAEPVRYYAISLDSRRSTHSLPWGLRIYRCRGPGFPICSADAPGSCVIAVQLDEPVALPGPALAAFGWYAAPVLRPRQDGAPLVPVELRVGRIGVPVEWSDDICIRENVDPAAPPIALGTGHEQNASITHEGLIDRDLALYGFAPDRARAVFQIGVSDPTRIDDDLAVVDVCRVNDLVADVHLERCGPGPRLRLPESGGWEGSPRFSPDGRWLAYLRTDPGPAAAGAELESDANLQKDLWLIPNPEAEAPQDIGRDVLAVNLTRLLDYPVLDYRWSCDGRCILAKLSVRGQTPIIQITPTAPRSGGRRHAGASEWTVPRSRDLQADPSSSDWWPEPLVLWPEAGAFIKEFAVDPSGRSLFAIESSLTRSSERIVHYGRDASLPAKAFVRCRLPDFQPPIAHDDPILDGCSQDPMHPGRRSEDIGVLRLPRPGPVSSGQALTDGAIVPSPHLQGRVFYPPCYPNPQTGDTNAPRERCDLVPDGHRFPLLFYLHGGPHQATYDRLDYLKWKLLNGYGHAVLPEGAADPVGRHGFVIVAPNPTGSIGFGDAYRRAAARDWGGQPLRDVIATIRAFTGKWREGKPIHPGGIYLVGDSYGGYLINLLQARRLDRTSEAADLDIAAAAPLFGVFDLLGFPCETDQLWFPRRQFGYFGSGTCTGLEPTLYKRTQDPRHYFDCALGERDPGDCTDTIRQSGERLFPMLVLHGTADQRVRIDESRKLVRALSRLEVPVRACELEAAGHGFTRKQNRDIHLAMLDWFTCLRDGSPSNACALVNDANHTDAPIDCRPGNVEAWTASAHDSERENEEEFARRYRDAGLTVVHAVPDR